MAFMKIWNQLNVTNWDFKQIEFLNSSTRNDPTLIGPTFTIDALVRLWICHRNIILDFTSTLNADEENQLVTFMTPSSLSQLLNCCRNCFWVQFKSKDFFSDCERSGRPVMTIMWSFLGWSRGPTFDHYSDNHEEIFFAITYNRVTHTEWEIEKV